MKTALSDINFSERRIIQKGQMGLKRTFTEVTTHANGKVTRKILDYTADDRLPIDEIIEVGSKVIQPSPSQGQVGDEKPVQPEQPSKEISQPSPGQAKDQPKESNKASQGQAQSVQRTKSRWFRLTLKQRCCLKRAKVNLA